MNLNESKDSDRLDQKKELKILLIGDCQVGKTCLSLKYFHNNNSRQAKSDSFSHSRAHDDFDCIHNEFDIYKLNSSGSLYEYAPTTLSVYKCDIKINSADYSLSLTDTSGCRHNEKFHQLRKHYYSIQKDIDVIMMCFSLVDPVSFSNISKKWYPEVRSSYPDVPILLVGTKLDIKHQIKYQKKNISKKSSNTLDDVKHHQQLLQSPINTPDLIINNRAANESFVNELNDGTLAQSIDNTAAMLNNKLAAAATTSPKSSFKKKSFKRCNYCSSLDQKSRSSRSSFLSTLTSSRQAETRARAVSIISKVSQQHTILVPQPAESIDPIDQETKLLENIHESNANLIAILNEDSAIISGNDDADLVRYNIDEYGVVEDEAFDADYFRNLNLAEDNCLCSDLDTNNNNVNDFNSYKLDQYEINENNNNNNNNECQLKNAANLKLNTSVKTLLLDTSEPKQPRECTDSECDLTHARERASKTEVFLIKRRECLKLKQSMNARKYLECSCLDEISVKIVMDTAIELALEYHLNKLSKLSKQTSNCSKQTTQTVGKNNGSLFKYSGLIGSLMKDSSLSTNSNLNSSNPTSQQQQQQQSKEFSLFSLSKSKNNNKVISNEKRDSKTFDDTDELKKKKSTVKSMTDLNVDSASVVSTTLTSANTKRSKQSKSKSQSKPDRQLSLRCLSCTRGINDTSSSLNKI